MNLKMDTMHRVYLDDAGEIKANYPGLQIKIIANPEENSIDTLDLYNFYDSINGIDEVVV